MSTVTQSSYELHQQEVRGNSICNIKTRRVSPWNMLSLWQIGPIWRSGVYVYPSKSIMSWRHYYSSSTLLQNATTLTHTLLIWSIEVAWSDIGCSGRGHNMTSYRLCHFQIELNYHLGPWGLTFLPSLVITDAPKESPFHNADGHLSTKFWERQTRCLTLTCKLYSIIGHAA